MNEPFAFLYDVFADELSFPALAVFYPVREPEAQPEYRDDHYPRIDL